ncbi:hypothetical protein PV392_08085 [Streptomyces sp. ME03-5709C]|nr:hypothetical protein [Streptomyces sp. ME03-5709C]
MPYEWSDAPTPLPNPGQVKLYFRKQWGSTVDDSAAAIGTLQFSAGDQPGRTDLDVLNDLVGDLATAGWQLYSSSATQEINRILEET